MTAERQSRFADALMRDPDFSLPEKERAVYGATVTARSLDTGDTLTIARTGMTAVQAVREITAALDTLEGRYRVVSISAPNLIERDLHASRVSLVGSHAGTVTTPEQALLVKIGRRDMLHPDLFRMSARNGRTMPRTMREAMTPDDETAA